MYSHSYPLHLRKNEMDGYLPAVSFTGMTESKTKHLGNSFSFSPSFFSPRGSVGRWRKRCRASSCVDLRCFFVVLV